MPEHGGSSSPLRPSSPGRTTIGVTAVRQHDPPKTPRVKRHGPHASSCASCQATSAIECRRLRAQDQRPEAHHDRDAGIAAAAAPARLRRSRPRGRSGSRRSGGAAQPAIGVPRPARRRAAAAERRSRDAQPLSPAPPASAIGARSGARIARPPRWRWPPADRPSRGAPQCARVSTGTRAGRTEFHRLLDQPVQAIAADWREDQVGPRLRHRCAQPLLTSTRSSPMPLSRRRCAPATRRPRR